MQPSSYLASAKPLRYAFTYQDALYDADDCFYSLCSFILYTWKYLSLSAFHDAFCENVRDFRTEMCCSFFLPLTCNQNKTTKIVIPHTALLGSHRCYIQPLSAISLIICLLFSWCEAASWCFPKPLYNTLLFSTVNLGLLLCLLTLWLIHSNIKKCRKT